MNYNFVLLFIFCIPANLHATEQKNENDYEFTDADVVLDTEKGATAYNQTFSTDTERSIIDDSPSEDKDKNIELEDYREAGTPYIISRFVGTFIGFGLGHLMQGRWLTSGWIYTIADLATLPVISDPWPLYGKDEDYKKGLAAYLLIKTIEIYDVWTFEETATAVTVKPVSFFHKKIRHYGFALSTTF